MKNIIIILVCLLIYSAGSLAQQVPQGMNYQAVARDLDGQVLQNQEISIKISLHDPTAKANFNYSETHHIWTNEIGLFSLIIGDGEVEDGTFDKIPWSQTEVFIAISIFNKERNEFIRISDSRLLAVPYAFHAATASQVINNVSDNRAPFGGVPAKVWTLKGNSNTNPEAHKLGTTDMADLVIVTNDIERMRITLEGNVILNHMLSVIEDVEVGNELRVAEGVVLNITGGSTTIKGELTVSDMSSTRLTGDLGVLGSTILYDKLKVENMANTHLTGELLVDEKLEIGGSSLLNGSLTVANMSPTSLKGSLTVDGSTLLKGSLVVLGESQFAERASFEGALNLKDSFSVLNSAPTRLTGNLSVEGESSFTDKMSLVDNNNSFVASFENTNNGNGDGLKIKLGKTHPRWNGSEVALTLPGQGFIEGAVNITKNTVMDFIDNGGQMDGNDFLNLGNELLRITEEQFAPGFDFIAASACNVTRDILSGLNDDVLPVTFPALTLPKSGIGGTITIPFPTGDIDIPVPDLSVGPIPITGAFPLIPEIPLPSCPSVPPFTESFNLPNFQLTNVNNTLTSENKFIQFTDKDDRQLGAIEAQSITEWGHSYLNATYFLNLFNSFAGVTVIGLDPTQIAETAGKYIINGIAQISTVIEDYNSIGVVYNSGFGDYAEWLERVNENEVINPGDIVGVFGGKISKNVAGAEQIMAVSTNPIVLGNAPDEADADLGNKVAFMGQIPVKIMGPVQSGDFIVAKNDIPGYGVAIHPNDMTVEDFEKAVGRSWETVEREGPKLVNTVIGVHNGSMINVMKKYVAKQEETDVRLNNIEEQLTELFPIVNSTK